MRTPLLLLAVLATAATAASKPTEEQRLQTALQGLVPGKPVECIRQGPTIQSDTFGGAIVYRDGGTRYLNRLGGDCPIRSGFDTLIVTLHGSLLCRGDIARVVDLIARTEHGSCAFDAFTPYTKPKK